MFAILMEYCQLALYLSKSYSRAEKLKFLLF